MISDKITEPCVGDVTAFKNYDYWNKKLSSIILYARCIHNWREPEIVNTIFTRGVLSVDFESEITLPLGDGLFFVRDRKKPLGK